MKQSGDNDSVQMFIAVKRNSGFELESMIIIQIKLKYRMTSNYVCYYSFTSTGDRFYIL